MSKTRVSLPQPDCKSGYTRAQVEVIMGSHLAEFDQWMNGQTQTICEGRLYNHETEQYEQACGGVSHDVITYTGDVERFLSILARR